MTLNLATLNARRLRDPSKCVRLLGELLKLRIYVVSVQETHFTCTAECRVLEDEYIVLSVFGSRSSVRVSLLIWRSLNADVNLILADDGDRLVVVNVAVKSFEFQVVAVYAPNIAAERFFRWLAPFFDNPKRIVLVDDWNAILDRKIDRVGKGASGSRRWESSLLDLMARYDLVDSFILDLSDVAR